MQRTILITGATDGIGLETARALALQGHRVLLHGRNPDKLQKIEMELSDKGAVESYIADLSNMADVMALAQMVKDKHASLDVLINNAGVLKAPTPVTKDGIDIRFVVNAIAPYLLTQQLLPLLGTSGRVVNLSSAAQAPVDVNALAGHKNRIDAMGAYSQSKLAITMWSRYMADSRGDNGPVIIAINPGSLLASKMVKEGFGIAGKDIQIGAEILVRAALSDEFANASGKYFDNDSEQFAAPHPDTQDPQKCGEIVHIIETVLARLLNTNRTQPENVA